MTNDNDMTFQELAEAVQEIDRLKAENAMLKHDIEAYRGALGYSVPADHNGLLTDGTRPQCGICTSDYQMNLEAENARLEAALKGLYGKGLKE